MYPQEFRNNPIEWHYGPDVIQTQSDDDLDWHGSCAASKAAGVTYGVAKQVRMIVLKSSVSHADVGWAFNYVVSDMYRHPGRRAVVMYASASETPASQIRNVQPWKNMFMRMTNIFQFGGVVVVPSGNEARRSPGIDTLPALYVQTLPVIVVGSVDNDGNMASFSQGEAGVSVWAPGVDVACLKGTGSRFDSGTSFSTGMVYLHPTLQKYIKSMLM